MLIFISWILLTVVVGVYANNKGLEVWPYVVCSLIFSPLIGGLFALVAKTPTQEFSNWDAQKGEWIKPPELDTRLCPFCAEVIKKAARVCKHCGRDLVEASSSEAGGIVKSD